MQTLERTAQVVGELQKIQAEAEQAKNAAESHEKALQERERHFNEEVQAKAQELSESVVVRSQRTVNDIKKQASAEIDKMRQERDTAVKQQAILQQQLRQERERSEQAIELATGYAYLTNEIGVPDHLQELDSEYWQQLQALRQPEQKQEQKHTKSKGNSYPSLG